jgi:uncharacterized protein DUF4398
VLRRLASRTTGRWLVPAVSLLGGLVTACATAPIQEMSDARQALQAADQAGAAQLAPASLKSAKAYVKKAEQALELRSYGEARRDAELARELAIRARSHATAMRSAQAAVQEAARLGSLRPETEALLRSAVDAARREKEEQALALAQAATDQAQASINRAQLKHARAQIKKLQRLRARLSPAQRSLLEAAEQAYREENGGKAAESLGKLMDELPPGLK